MIKNSSYDPFSILEIEPTNEELLIKSAFRKMAKKYHPDHDPSFNEKFLEIKSAYDTLMNEDSRDGYFKKFSPLRIEEAFDNFFNDLQENGRGGFDVIKPKRTKGSDIYRTISITLQQSLLGDTIHLDTNSAPCSVCNGKGKYKSALKKCIDCNGHGFQRKTKGFLTSQIKCSTCDGHGTSHINICPVCNGTGQTDGEKIKITIPPLTRPDSQITLENYGAPGYNGGGSGNLIVKVIVQDDSEYHINGNDILTHLKVDIWDAVLGTTKVIKSPFNNNIEIKIPPGSQDKDQVTIKNIGYQNIHGIRGNLLVFLDIKIPNGDDKIYNMFFKKMKEFFEKNQLS